MEKSQIELIVNALDHIRDVLKLQGEINDTLEKRINILEKDLDDIMLGVDEVLNTLMIKNNHNGLSEDDFRNTGEEIARSGNKIRPRGTQRAA